jgi:hypothetical protein
LTPRERDICRDVINGYSTSDSAGRLHFQQYRARSSKVDLRQGRRTQSRRARRSATAQRLNTAG